MESRVDRKSFLRCLLPYFLPLFAIQTAGKISIDQLETYKLTKVKSEPFLEHICVFKTLCCPTCFYGNPLGLDNNILQIMPPTPSPPHRWCMVIVEGQCNKIDKEVANLL